MVLHRLTLRSGLPADTQPRTAEQQATDVREDPVRSGAPGRGFSVDSIEYSMQFLLACPPRDLPLLPVFGPQQLEMRIAHPGS